MELCKFCSIEEKLRSLQDEISSIPLEQGDQPQDKNPSVLVEINDELNELHENLRDLRGYKYTCSRQRVGKETSHLAQKVFYTPELLDFILGNLEIRDVLGMMQINKTFAANINASATLKRNFAPALGTGKFFRTAFTKDCRFMFRCEVDQHAIAPLCGVSEKCVPGYATVFASFIGVREPRLGTRWREMLVCTPRIYRMKVNLSCCHGHYGDFNRTSLGVVILPTFQSAGALQWDSCLTLRRSFANNTDTVLLPRSPIFWKTDPRKIRVVFTPQIEVDFGDPLLQRRAEKKARRRRQIEHSNKISQYAKAKHTAFVNGQDIPTLAEFEAT